MAPKNASRASFRRLVFAVLVAVLPALFVAGPAFAGTRIASAAEPAPRPVSWSPAPGSTVSTAVKTITVTFDRDIAGLPGRTGGLQLEVVGPNVGKQHFEAACPKIENRSVVVPVALGGPGSYRIIYQVVTADGQIASGEGQFDYEPAGPVVAADGAAAPVCVDGRVTAGPSTPATTQSGDDSSAVLLGVVAGAIVLALGGMIVAGRRGRPRRSS
ncbi:MAG TPA: copper resistance CopC family protein [Microbacteriaceae bacterium]|nr:copper resistance CopC family protein [Microbacteriaceae bacterium]